MKKTLFFCILVFLLNSIQAQDITAIGVQFGTGADSAKVVVVQESRAGLNTGGIRVMQDTQPFANLTDAEAFLKTQLQSIEYQVERLFKLRKDITASMEAIEKRKKTPQAATTKKVEPKAGSAGGLPDKPDKN